MVKKNLDKSSLDPRPVDAGSMISNINIPNKIRDVGKAVPSTVKGFLSVKYHLTASGRAQKKGEPTTHQKPSLSITRGVGKNKR